MYSLSGSCQNSVPLSKVLFAYLWKGANDIISVRNSGGNNLGQFCKISADM